MSRFGPMKVLVYAMVGTIGYRIADEVYWGCYITADRTLDRLIEDQKTKIDEKRDD